AGDLVLGEHDRQAPGSARRGKAGEVARVAAQYVAIQKSERHERLVLRRGGDVPLHRQVGQESTDFLWPHFLRMAFLVVQNELPNPANVTVFRAPGELSVSRYIATLVQKFSLRGKLSRDKSRRCRHRRRGG